MSFRGRFGLTWLFAVAAAVAFVILGYFLTHRLVDVTTDTLVADEGEHAENLIAPQVRNFLSPGDFESGLPADRLDSLDRFVRGSILSQHFDQLTIWDPRGAVLYSSNANLVGKTFPPSKDRTAAGAGRTLADTVSPTAGSTVDEGLVGKHFEIYAPVAFAGAGAPAGVLELSQPYSTIASEISSERQRIVIALTGGLGMVYVALVGIVYGGGRTIRRQHTQLTQATHAQARNERERDRLVAILESTPDAVGIIDLAGRPLYMNRVARAAALAADVPGATAVTVSGLYPSWAAEVVTREGLPTAISEGSWSGETALLGPDGEEHPVSQVIIAHRGDDGEVEYLSSILRDISAQKEVEQELRRSEESFRQLFAANPQALMVHDLVGEMLEVNDAMLRMYGHTREEFLALNVTAIFAPDERERFKAYLDARDPLLPADAGDWRTVRKDGTEFWIRGKAQAIHFAGRPARLAMVEDITARKQTEEEVMRLVSILDATTDFVGAAAMDGQITYTNRAYRALINETEGSGGRRLGETHPAWARELVLNTAIPTALREGSWQGETALLTPDGRELPVSQVILAHNLDGNGPPFLSTIMRDISAAKQAEEELIRLVSILDATTDFVGTADLDGRITFTNRAHRALFNVTGDSGERNLAETHPAWARDLVLHTAIPAALREGFWQGETALLTPDGREIPVSQVILAHNLDGSGPPYLSTIMRDISAVKQAATVLQRREEDSRLLFEANPQAMWLFEPETFVILAANEAAGRQYGYTPGEFLGMSEKDIRSPEEERTLAGYLATVSPGEPDAGEWRHLRKDGTPIWVHLRVHSIEFGGREALMVAADDVTERKQIEAQFLQAQKMEGIGQLAGGIAHDFNNLITVMVGYAELARSALPATSPIRADIQEVMGAANRARDLTQQLLAFARKQIVQPRILNLNDLVRDMHSLLRPLIGEDVELTTAPDPELGLTKIDPGQLEQVLVNLAVNARDAMPSGGKFKIETANVSIGRDRRGYPPEAPPGPYVCLTVTDTGTGMDETTLAHLFEPFFTTKEPGKGTGLGLATCYGIVRQAGGYIAVASTLGKGTSFSVYLPRVGAMAAEAADDHPEDEIRGGSETILLVEDDVVLRKLAERVLGAAGYHIISAATGPEALARLAQPGVEVDLVVTDMVMPQMSGLQLAERVLAGHPKTRILLVSGYSDDLVAGRGIGSDTVAFLPKPFTMTKLAQKVREVLDAPGLASDVHLPDIAAS